MYFLALGIGDVPNIINSALRAIEMLLCNLIYPLIADMYNVFQDMGKLVYNDQFKDIYGGISLLLGIYMVFRISFWLIEYLVDPNRMNSSKDGSAGPTKIVTRTLIVVVLLALTPTIFEEAFKIQTYVIEGHVIEKLVGRYDDSSDDFNMGNYLSGNLFDNFYGLKDDGVGLTNAELDKCEQGEKGGMNSYTETLIVSGKLKLTTSCVNATTNDGYYVLDFHGLYAVIIGGVVVWMLIMYCISIGTRYVQLIFLQVVAPVPIMCYLSPSKDNMFEKWLKQCTTTYLDLFIRVAIFSFIMLLCRQMFATDVFDIDTFGGRAWIIEMFVILGLLTFAKKAPELIQELLPKSVTKASGDFGLSLKKRTDAMLGGKYIYSAPKKALGFGLASVDTLRRAGVRAWNAHKYNKRSNESLDRYRTKQIESYEAAKRKVEASNLDEAKKKNAIAKIDSRINSLKNMSNGQLRRNLRLENRNLRNALEQHPEMSAEQKAKLYNKYTANVNSGLGYRNQAATFVTSVGGGIIDAADSALHNNKISDIVRKNAQKTTKSINAEQKWYAGNNYTVSNVIQRTISEIQRNYGIETEGQAVQYIIDGLNAEVKLEEENLAKAKEKQQIFSTISTSSDSVEKKGTADVEKNKTITYFSENGKKVPTTYNTDILAMDSEHARLSEVYGQLSVKDVTTGINDDAAEVHKNAIKQMIQSICNKTGRTDLNDDWINNNIFVEGTNVGQAYNMALTQARQFINKEKNDRGKLQGAAAVLTGIMKQNDPNFEGGYDSIAIQNEWRSMERAFTSPENVSSLSFDVVYTDSKGNKRKCKAYELPEKVRDLVGGRDVKFTEDLVKNAQSIISLMKDTFERCTGEQSSVVSDISEKVQGKKHEVTAFSQYSRTTDAINADKYEGGK